MLLIMTDELATSVILAKKELGRELRVLEGFAGIGMGEVKGRRNQRSIRVYVSSIRAPVARYVHDHYGDKFHGYPIAIVESGGFRAQGVERKL